MKPQEPHPSFISLTPSHGRALERFLCEFDDRTDELHGYFCDRHLSVEEVSDLLEAWSEDRELPTGWVGSTTRFWGDEHQIHGVINIRHHLTAHLEELGGHIGYCIAPSSRRQGLATAMLKEALKLCREKEIMKVLITCDTENVASWKTIERCGGVLAREEWSDLAAKVQRWYWVDFSS